MTTSAGWHPDNTDPSRERFWDGSQWTDQTRPKEGAAPAASDGKLSLRDRAMQAKDAALAAKQKIEEKQQQVTAERTAQAAAAGVLFQGTSHDSGKNATVTLYTDRIERVKAKSMGSLSRASQDVEMTPMRSVSSVQAKKDGMAYTKVTVYASGNNIEFRFSHAEAARFRDLISQAILRGPEPVQAAAPAPAAAPQVDVVEQLTKLAALRDQGILSDEEFAAQKAKLLS